MKRNVNHFNLFKNRIKIISIKQKYNKLKNKIYRYIQFSKSFIKKNYI